MATEKAKKKRKVFVCCSFSLIRKSFQHNKMQNKIIIKLKIFSNLISIGESEFANY